MAQKLRFVTANFSGKVRREIFNSREYLVVPVTMIVPGVLNGSRGPLLYPPKEAGRNPEAWNYMPITDGHPIDDNDRPVSARSPDVLERVGLGFVFHSEFKGKLRGEGWFDVERTRWVNPKVYNALRRGKPFELSTGLYTENEPKRGIWNNRRYDAIARNYRPDHLAVLIEGVGACSLKDGCGVNVNKRGKPKRKRKKSKLSKHLYNELLEEAQDVLDQLSEALAANSNEEDDGVNYEDDDSDTDIDVDEIVDELEIDDEEDTDEFEEEDLLDDEDDEDLIDEDEEDYDDEDDDDILEGDWAEVGDDDDEDDDEEDEEEAA